MTSDTVRRELVCIGVLSELTGVSVRKIRFYCDNGVLESTRSGGGHRMFERESAVARLLLIRRLRAVGLGLVSIGAVLRGERSMAEAVAAERAAVDVELGALAWRRASLCAIENADPNERAARLELVSAVHDGHRAHDTLVAFWRRTLARPPSAVFDGFLDMNVPAPPRDPTPEAVVGYAELVALVTDRHFAAVVSQQLWCPEVPGLGDRTGLIAGVGAACGMAESDIHAGREPFAGTALDRFVDAHASARGTRDTAGFRERLRGCGHTDDARAQRYWRRTGELLGTLTTAGAAQRWLFEALAR
ncbi:MerR family transcriptional regulator [Nocardia sp. NPDC050406]|uniref:MerR family transcriptional regulator n=1 Tax=Nocardia sp. NPDC050406 TaxID=3364318 RepID=UPI00379D7D77